MIKSLFQNLLHREIALIVVSLCLVFSFGCGKKEVPTTKNSKKPEKAVSLSIGLIPEHNIFKQIERYKPLASYLSKQTGLEIKLHVLSRYGNIIDNFISAGLDGAFFGSFTYALAHSKIGVEVLARPENLDGTSTYYGMLFVRKDSGIKTGKDMKGKRFAFVDKATTAGYLLPLDYFKEQGIGDYHTFFSETYFTGTHEDAIYDVINKKADVGAAKNTVFYRLAQADDRILKELSILVRSPDVPSNALALKKDIDVSVRKKLREALLKMDRDPEGKRIMKEFGAKRFIETTDQDYDPVFSYANHVGLDLAIYDYIND